MKKFMALLLTAAMVLSVAACGSTKEASEDTAADTASTEETAEEAAEPVELIVFAAASMTETLTEIGDLYMKENPNVTLTFSFGSSGTLKTQIEEGSPCDLFISAAQKQMNALDAADTTGTNENGADFILSDSRMDLLENKVVLCVADNSSADINSYDDLAKALTDGTATLAMGNEDVPVGQYTQKIFAYYNIDEASIASNLVYGSDVKEVTTAVSEGTVDCGIIYATDAFSAGLTPVDMATAEMCGQVIYPAAVLKDSAHAAEAQAFLDFLTTSEAKTIFEKVGFTAMN